MASPVIDRNNPWPWLDPFTEKAESFFNGREDDSAALQRCVLSGAATVLFGKSGLGKTSLLQAGLFPLLRKSGLLPVLVRLEHGSASPTAAAQIRACLHKECMAYGLTLPGNAQFAPQLVKPEDRLWLDLHTNPVGLRDVSGQTWQVVFVLDQFEEIFTLGGQDSERQKIDFGALGDLVENRIPSALENAISADEDLLDELRLDVQPYRVVFSLREDYLPNLERWCDRIPRLGPNRYRLLPMQQAQALDAIRLTGGDLVSPQDAEYIIRFVSSQQEASAMGMASGESADVSIEPALLSLLCSGLNLERQKTGAAQLDASNLEQSGGRIMESFYDAATLNVAPAAIAFVEDELITPDGIRLFYPLKSILQNPGITKADIDTLIERRLLRRQPFSEGDRIEIVHDRLAAVARLRRQNRESANAQQRQLEQARQEAATKEAIVRADLESKARESESRALLRAQKDAAAQRRLQQILRYVVAALIVLLCVAGAFAWVARDQSLLAQAAELKAKKLAEEASIRRLVAEGQAMTTGAQSGGSILGMLQLLAAHRLSDQAYPQTSPGALGALRAEFVRSARLLRLSESDAVITTLDLSPDGQRIVTGSRNGSLQLWDAATGVPIGQPLAGHKMYVNSVAFSRDGKLIVSASRDHTLRLWDAGTGNPLGQPLQSDSAVCSVAFSPIDQRIVSGGLDGSLSLWDAATGQALGKPFKAYNQPVWAVAFSPDGKSIVSGGDDAILRLWDSSTGQAVGKALEGHTEAVNSVAFSPNGLRIVSGSNDATLRLWDVKTGKTIGEPLKRHRQAILAVAFSADGRYIVSGSRDHSVRLWDAETWQSAGDSLRGHTDEVTGALFALDGKRVISGSYDKTLRLWAAVAEDPTSIVLKGSDKALKSVAYGRKGTLLVWAGEDQDVHVLDLAIAPAGSKTFSGHQATIYSVAVSPDGKRIASGSGDMTVRLWDASTGTPVVPPLQGHLGTVYSVAFSPDGVRLASASEDGTLRLWNVATGAPMGNPLLGHSGTVASVAFSPDGKRLVSGGEDKTLRLWDVASGKPIGQPLIGHAKAVNSVAFSPDGRYIVSASDDMSLHLWDALSGAPIGKPLIGHTHYVNSVAFSPDGRHLVSGSRDQTLRLWDIRSGISVGAPFEGHSETIFGVAFSPDGRQMVSVSGDSTVRRWPVLEAWAERLCAKLGRNMSDNEWQHLVSPDIPYTKQCPDLPKPGD